MKKKVSIIIPAYNEEKNIEKIIKGFKALPYKSKEIIVVVNNTKDKTYLKAKKLADKTLVFPGNIGVCRARNEGVKVSTGDVLIFSDADSKLSKGAIGKVVKAITPGTFGSCIGRGDNDSLKGKIFFFYKNWSHRLGIYKGVVDGVFFCHRGIFNKIGGFNEKLKIAEFRDFMERGYKEGGKYKLLTNCYAVVDLRRYEEEGYIKVHWFWIKHRIATILGRGEKLSGQYFKKK